MMPYMNQNPNYYAQYLQPQYQQNLQVQQPQSQFNALGKVVENVETVRMTEIPYQGVYYFPTADGTAIHTKQWLSTGQTQILTFKPVSENNPINNSSDDIKTQILSFCEVLGAIQSDLKTLTDKVDRISTTPKKKGGAEIE